MDIVTYDGDANGSNYLQTKVSLFNRTGSGWPDVVFSPQNNEATWAVQAGFTAPLNKGLIPQATLDGWATDANAPCTVDGTVYCLRNDLSQTVLWYNDKLMKQWGYQVPTTWEQYQALGEKVATEHPGYLVGAAGDTFAPEIYLWAGKCGANQITGPKAVTVDTTSPACTKMASLLDTLIANKTMSDLQRVQLRLRQERGRQDPDDARPVLVRRRAVPGHVQDPGRADRASRRCRSGPATPARRSATSAAAPGCCRRTARTSRPRTDFLTWVTTSDDYQGKLAPGYPAYAPAAKTWLAAQAASGYYADDITAPLTAAANQVWPDWGYGQFSQEAIWAATVTPGVTAGKTIVSLLPAWQTRSSNYARADGYQVTSK